MKSFQILNPNSSQPILITCEHASKIIPERYNNLGVKDLSKLPDWHDVGAQDLAVKTAQKLNACCLIPLVSRMVINLNKPLNHPDLINRHCFGKPIPGNLELNKKDKMERIFKYYLPFHHQLKRELTNLKKQHSKIFFVSIHSFFHILKGKEKTIDIGVLYKYEKDAQFCQKLKDSIKRKTNFIVRFNEPYSAHKTAGYTMNKYGNHKNINCVEFEINDKHLKTKENIEKIGNLLTEVLKKVI